MLKAALRNLYYKGLRNIAPSFAFPCRNILIELTYRCNLSCKMCSILSEIEVKEKRDKRRELNANEILVILNNIPPKSNITFSGGEIFLKKDIDEILSKAAKRHKVTIATNGLLLREHLKTIIQCGIKAIGVSIDGTEKVHDNIRNRDGGYSRIIEDLITINSRIAMGLKGPKINVNSVILKENYSVLPDVTKILKEIGITSYSLQIYDPSVNRSGLYLQESINIDSCFLNKVEKINPTLLNEALNLVFDEGKKRKINITFLPDMVTKDIVSYYNNKFKLNNWECFYPWTTMRISPYGDVYPCLNIKIGNVKESTIKDLWNSMRYKEFRRKLIRHGIFPACTGCCKMAPIANQ